MGAASACDHSMIMATSIAQCRTRVTTRPAAEAAGLVARPLPLVELARAVAQLGWDHGLHQHVPLRVQSVPVVGGGNLIVDTAMSSYFYAYIQVLQYIHR